MSGADTAILLFASTHDVLAAEEILTQKGLWSDIVPVPHTLSSECGMALEIRQDDIPALEALRAQGDLSWAALHTEY